MTTKLHGWRLHFARRTLLLAFVHLILFTLSLGFALLLRFDMVVPDKERDIVIKALPWVLPLKLLIFHFLGSLHGWWRYVTFADLASLLRVSTVATISIAFVDYFFIDYQIPRSVLLLDWGITILLIGGLRSICRLVRESWWPAISLQNRKPTLLVGAAEGGAALVRQIHTNANLDYRVIGFLDQRKAHHGTWLGGIPFLGGVDDAVSLARHHGVKELLVISNSLTGDCLRKMMSDCRQAKINVKMIPPIDEFISGRIRLQTRDVDINDLLQRDQVKLDTEAISGMLSGKRVMVTGAGGSIGSEICRQIARCSPESLLLVERAENSLFTFERETHQIGYASLCVPCIADICDESRMRGLFQKHRPEIVFHAAAHKHVPLMEQNPAEAIKNNVLGTAALVDLCDEFDVDRFVMISTDKAVNPTSIMGVSKQLAERFVHAKSEISDTKFVVVRFGNVLASNGSVVPIFQEQIRRGGPVTVTHPDMTRFFMTIPEASQLVLQASAMGRGGEIFVLDMGEQVKIVDLAVDLIRLSGLTTDEVPLEFTGIRPGEKLYEELYMDSERMLDTAHPKVRTAYHIDIDHDQILLQLEILRQLVNDSEVALRRGLCELADEYTPTNVLDYTRTTDPAAAESQSAPKPVVPELSIKESASA